MVLSEQIQPGTFEFALDHLVDHKLDLSALGARFSNDQTGASAYDPRVMLKIVLLAYSWGLISSRSIEAAGHSRPAVPVDPCLLPTQLDDQQWVGGGSTQIDGGQAAHGCAGEGHVVLAP